MDADDKSRKWTTSDRVALLEEVHKYPSLWNKTHPEYMDVVLRESTLQEVRRALGSRNLSVTVRDEILGKIKNMKTMISSHLSKRRVMTGAALEKLQWPGWWDAATFLRNAGELRQRKNNMTSAEETSPSMSSNADTRTMTSSVDGSSFTSMDKPESLPPRPHRKRKVEEVPEMPSVDNELALLLDNVATKLSDAYAQYISHRMSQIPPPFRHDAEEGILRILNHYYRLSRDASDGGLSSAMTSLGLAPASEVVSRRTSCESFIGGNETLADGWMKNVMHSDPSAVTALPTSVSTTPAIPLVMKPASTKPKRTILTPSPIFPNPNGTKSSSTRSPSSPPPLLHENTTVIK